MSLTKVIHRMGKHAFLHFRNTSINKYGDVHDPGYLTGYALFYCQMQCEISTKESGEQMRTLLKGQSDLEVTESKIAAAAYRFNPGMMEILLAASRSSLITKTLWKAAAGNEWSGKAIIELLSRKSEIVSLRDTECCSQELTK
jgi:hypothetical protein